MAIDSNDNKYITKSSAHWQSFEYMNEIHKIDSAGNASLFYLPGTTVRQVAIDSNDTLYVSTGDSKKIIKIETNNGVLGTVTNDFAGSFNSPSGYGGLRAIAVDNDDNIYAHFESGYDPHVIYKIDPSGSKSEYVSLPPSINSINR